MSEQDSQRSCSGCGRPFTCGMAAGLQRCWCAELPALPAEPEADKGCYCPDCLKERLAAGALKTT